MDRPWSSLSSAERFAERAKRKRNRLKERRNSSKKAISTLPAIKEKESMDDDLLQQAVNEHAVFLGMDPEEDEDFLWIAEESLTAPLPPGWLQGEAEDGTPYHYNEETNESIWEHPRDQEYRELFQREKAKKMAELTEANPERSTDIGVTNGKEVEMSNDSETNDHAHSERHSDEDVLIEDDIQEIDDLVSNEESSNDNRHDSGKEILKGGDDKNKNKTETKDKAKPESKKNSNYFWESGDNPYGKPKDTKSQATSEASLPASPKQIQSIKPDDTKSTGKELERTTDALIQDTCFNRSKIEEVGDNEKERLAALEKIKTLSEDVARLRDSKKRSEVESLARKKELDKLRNLDSIRNKKILTLESELENLKASLERKTTELISVTNNTSHISNSYKAEKDALQACYEKEKEALKFELKQANSKIENLQLELNMSNERANMFQQEVDRVKQESIRKEEKLKQESDSKSKEVELQAITQNHAQIDNLMNKLEGVRERLESERVDRRQEVDILTQKVQSLENENVTLKQNESTIESAKKKLQNLEEKEKQVDIRLAEIKQYESEITKTEQKRSQEDKKEKAVKDAYIERCKTLVEEKQTLISKQDTQRLEMRDKFVSLEATNNRIRLELQIAKDEHKKQTSTLESELFSTKQLLQQSKSVCTKLESKVESHKHSEESLQTLLDQKTRQWEHMKLKVEELTVQLDEMNLNSRLRNRYDDEKSKNCINNESELKLKEQIKALENDNIKLKEKHAEDIRDAMLEITKKVGEQWRSHVEKQVFELQQQHAAALSEAKSLREQYERRENDMMLEISALQDRSRSAKAIAQNDVARTHELNRHLLELLDKYSTHQPQHTIEKNNPNIAARMPTNRPVEQKNQVESNLKIMKLNSQLQQLHEQFKALENQENSEANRLPTYWLPVNKTDEPSIWEEDTGGDEPLSISCLRGDKPFKGNSLLNTPSKLGGMSIVEKSMIKRKQVLFSSSTKSGSQYQTNYWKEKYSTP